MEVLYQPENSTFKILCFGSVLDKAIQMVHQAILDVEEYAKDYYPESWNMWGILVVSLASVSLPESRFECNC